MTADAGTTKRSTVPGERGGWVHVCERCGERMEERHCKIRCGNCGFTRDCSDP
jgi:exosome complex RNA-binding protein Csl4